MNVLMSAIVLIFEVLYYAIFMKFTRKDGKFLKYLLLFTLINVLFLFIGTNEVYSYLLLIVLIVYGIKYVVKLKVSLYDMLIVFLMLLTKVLIETPLYVLMINFINNFAVIMISGIIKIGILYLLRNKLNVIYNKLKEKWDNNNFYIRYLFTVAVFLYLIASCVFLIVKFV